MVYRAHTHSYATQKSKTSWEECAKLIREKFGVERTKGALLAHIDVMGLSRSRQVTEWSQDELHCLWNLMSSDVDSSEVYTTFWKRFGAERSRASIQAKASELKNDGGISLPLRRQWRNDEEKFIKTSTHSRPKDVCATFHAKFGTHRSAASIGRKLWMAQRNRGD